MTFQKIRQVGKLKSGYFFLLLKTDILLTKLDTVKQIGYLLGMGLAYLFYKILTHYGVEDNQRQVYDLHFLLIAVELVVIVLIIKSFKRVK